MLQRDESIVLAIHTERAAALLAGPGAGSERSDRPRPNLIRRALGHGLVRLGVWLSAEPAHPATARPRVPSSVWGGGG
jgi:hypothetical protein